MQAGTELLMPMPWKGFTMFSQLIEIARNHVARNFALHAAYAGAGITGVAAGVAVGQACNSYLSGVAVGLTCAAAWFVRRKGPFAAAPYFVICWVALTASYLYAMATYKATSFYILLLIVLFGLSGTFNLWVAFVHRFNSFDGVNHE